jgi:hypothetical protein
VKGANLFFIIGLVLAVAGAVLLVVGIVGYNDAKASVANAIGKLIKGRSQLETTAIVEMAAGAGAAVIGLVLLLRGRRG